jgi:hypothetical protein
MTRAAWLVQSEITVYIIYTIIPKEKAMTKTGATKKPASPSAAKPATSTAVKPAAAQPAIAKPAAAKPAPGKAKPATAGAKTAAVPKAKPAGSPAKIVPVAPSAAKAAAPKPIATGLNGHGGKAGKAKPVLEPKEKAKKPKLVRDSFTMPEQEYQALGDVKKACLKAGIEVKKSELLRVGVALVKQLDLAKLKAALGALAPLKAGRPKKEK